MILTVSLNPSVDHALFLNELKLHDTNRVKRTERDAGGKGINVARVAAELGAEVLATGFLGGGPGAYVRSVLDAQGVRHDFLEVPGVTRTNFSVEDNSDLPPTTFNEPGPEISSTLLDDLRDHCSRMASTASWVCFGGSLPPGVPNHVFRTMIEECKCRSCSVVLDADGDPLRLGMDACPTFIKPNAKEAARLLGKPMEDVGDCVLAARELELRLRSGRVARSPIVVISRGQEGAVLACEGEVLIGRSPKVQLNSTIGSGDSLIGGMLWALEDGRPLEEAFRWGMAAGAATATTNGSEIARKPMVLRLFPEARVERAQDA